MLNLFPIQFLALFAYFILRIGTGFVLLFFAHSHFRHRASLAETIKIPFFPFGKFTTLTLILSELVISFLLIFGLYTQIGALLLIILSFKIIIWHKRFSHPAIASRLTYFLLLAIGLSLFITGAGVFAFDLPI